MDGLIAARPRRDVADAAAASRSLPSNGSRLPPPPCAHLLHSTSPLPPLFILTLVLSPLSPAARQQVLIILDYTSCTQLCQAALIEYPTCLLNTILSCSK
ncbi:hypothetical protein CVT26_007742, partial [Gymnopilus dilepis]